MFCSLDEWHSEKLWESSEHDCVIKLSPLVQKEWVSYNLRTKGSVSVCLSGRWCCQTVESLSWESVLQGQHRAPLWTADINLRRQRSGGVWLSSHTTTHISTHRETQTRPYAYSLCNSRERERQGERMQCPIPHSLPTIKMSFFGDDLHITFKLQACRHRRRHVIASCHCDAHHHRAQRRLSSTDCWGVWLPDQCFTSASSA